MFNTTNIDDCNGQVNVIIAFITSKSGKGSANGLQKSVTIRFASS